MIDPAGKIEVLCLSRLALVAAKYLRQGDRVAVVGFLSMSEWQSDAGEWHNDAELIAMDLELVKGDDHTQRIRQAQEGQGETHVRRPGLDPIRGELPKT